MVTSLLYLVPYLLPMSTTTHPDILFLLQTQSGPHHTALATRTEKFLLSQYQHLDKPDIVWSSRDLQYPLSLSAWTVFTVCKTCFERFVFNQNIFILVESCAEFLLRFPEVEWVVILNENTDFYLENFMNLLKEEEWNPRKDLVFMGKEIIRYTRFLNQKL